jgi:hypothetical protein
MAALIAIAAGYDLLAGVIERCEWSGDGIKGCAAVFAAGKAAGWRRAWTPAAMDGWGWKLTCECQNRIEHTS